jgi:hypothetical protein
MVESWIFEMFSYPYYPDPEKFDRSCVMTCTTGSSSLGLVSWHETGSRYRANVCLDIAV